MRILGFDERTRGSHHIEKNQFTKRRKQSKTISSSTGAKYNFETSN